MGLTMKNFNNSGVHWKIRFSDGGGSRKTNIDGAECLKMRTWSVCRFYGGVAWQKIWSSVFGGGLIPQFTLWAFWNEIKTGDHWTLKNL